MTANQIIKAGLAGSIVAITAGVVFIVLLKGDATDKSTLGAVLPTVLTCFALVYQNTFKHEDSKPDRPADPPKQ